jgi:S-(hydroxymethyl)glutathione dehydrogenase/alcohol dehydrogenase
MLTVVRAGSEVPESTGRDRLLPGYENWLVAAGMWREKGDMAMRAALFNGTQVLEIDDIEIADPGPGQVRVRVHHCGICHSDYTVVDGMLGVTPQVLGHEASGVVDAIGEGVKLLAVGDKVVMSPVASCGRCYWCTRGQPTQCVTKSQAFSSTFVDGTTGLSRRGEMVYRGMSVGGFAQYALADETGAVKVPDDTPLEIACVIGCAVQTGTGAALNTAKVVPGATVLVLGLGGIGLSVVQGAHVAGAARIISSDPNAARRDMAQKLGATDVIDPTEVDVIEATMEITGRIGADYAFEAAGVASLQPIAIEATRAGGTTVLVGAPAFDQSLTIPSSLMWGMSEKRLMGCFMGSTNSLRDIPAFLALWRSGQLDLESLITSRRPLDEINEGFADLGAGVGIRTVIDL